MTRIGRWLTGGWAVRRMVRNWGGHCPWHRCQRTVVPAVEFLPRTPMVENWTQIGTTLTTDNGWSGTINPLSGGDFSLSRPSPPFPPARITPGPATMIWVRASEDAAADSANVSAGILAEALFAATGESYGARTERAGRVRRIVGAHHTSEPRRPVASITPIGSAFAGNRRQFGGMVVGLLGPYPADGPLAGDERRAGMNGGRG